MGSKYPHVFSPITIRGVQYKNRLEMAPQSPGWADSNGFVTTEFVEMFRKPARGGVGMITIGSSHVHLSECRDEERQLDLYSDECILPLSRFATMCKNLGVQPSIEVNYAGQDGMFEYTGHAPYGPTAGFTPGELARAAAAGRKPMRIIEMDYDKIQEVIGLYVAGAARAKQAGFNMCMIHGAHGNCIGTFASPYYNKRRDEYGGSLENRARFALEILQGVRKKCGEDFVIEYRISADEVIPGGMHFEETLDFLTLIQDYVDIVHVSAGIHADQKYMRNWLQPYNCEQMMNVHYAAKVKKFLPERIKVATVGSIMNVANAEMIIANGDADFVAMARPFVADPEMPRKYATGREEDHVPCIRCGWCGRSLMFKKPMECAVNPFQGHDNEYPHGVQKADEKKRVAVIGGGPAGLQAMMTLVKRGHDVTLYEKSGELCGNLIPATALPIKQDLRNYVKYLRAQAAKTPAKILLNTEATPELLNAENYDAIVIAVGADPGKPPVEGIDKPFVHWAPEADMGTIEVGQNVVIIGGATIGMESGLELSKAGKNVTVVEFAAPFVMLRKALGSSAIPLIEELEASGMNLMFDSVVDEIRDGEVIIRDRKTLKKTVLPVDTVLYATGMRPRSALVDSLRHCAPETEVYVVGDCYKAGSVVEAVATGFTAAANI